MCKRVEMNVLWRWCSVVRRMCEHGLVVTLMMRACL